uniref:Uncharacterized protein n=1 Tax=Anopheles atroparvus TaxID=41427 RepID=A0A182J1L1_ANOAO
MVLLLHKKTMLMMMMVTGASIQLPVPYAKAGVNGGTAIPLPATVLVTRRCPPDKVRPLPPTPNQQTGLHGGLQKHTLGSVGGGVSNSTPSDGNSCPGSPQHNGTAIITQIPKGNNSLRLPQATNCKIPASPYAASTANAATLQHNNHHNNNNNNTITLIPNGNVTNIPTNPAQHQKHSMLDKFKLFNSKEKQDRAAQKSQISKRTSSSSGFSSARSERSDSSLSLDNGHHQSTATTMVIPGAKIKESGLKKLDSATKSSSSSVAVSSAAKSSSKLISSKSSSKEAAKAAAKAEKLQRNSKDPGAQDPTGPQTHIPLAPQKAQKIPMATTVMTTSMAAASSPGASAMASKVAAAESARLKLASQQQATTNSGGNSMSDSMHSNSTQGASMGQHSNSSETSSVVAYRPSSESGSEQLLHSPQKLVPSNGGSVALLYAGQPDVNLNSSSSNGSASPAAQNGVFHNGHNHNLNNNNINHLSKFNTVPTKILNTSNGAVGGPTTTTIYEQEEKQITVLPMRPLLRGYNSHVTLPTRGTRGHHPHHPHVSQQHLPQHHQLMAADYCEDYGGLGGGYCSDGDALRKIPARYSDNIDNGYLSEGGGGGGSGASMLTGNGRQQHASYINSLRARTQLPTTIEERCRSSRGDHLDSVGTNPPAMEHSHVNGKSSSSSSARHSSGSSIGPNGREYWGKLPDPSGGHGSSNGGSSSQHSSQPPSPTVSRKDKTVSSPGQSRRSTPSSKEVQQHPQYRSFSLTGPGAAQLSQSVKERMSNRASAKLTDGSLSDTQTYAEVKPDYGSYAMWLKHSNTASSRLSEGDTLDAISMGTSPAAAVAAVTGSPGSVTRPHKLLHHTRGETQQPHHHHHHHSNTTTATNSPRLNRSNSIRSTKSEKMYPSMLSRGPDVDIEPYYCLPVGTVVHPGNGMVPWSQPTSPTPPARGFGGLLSPTHTNAGTAGGRLTYPKKNDEVHGSQASLLSGGSSLYGSTEERQAGEVRRLKRELIDARDQVMSLSSQLSTNRLDAMQMLRGHAALMDWFTDGRE